MTKPLQKRDVFNLVGRVSVNIGFNSGYKFVGSVTSINGLRPQIKYGKFGLVLGFLA